MLGQRKHPSDRDRAARQWKDEPPAAGRCGVVARCRSLRALLPDRLRGGKLRGLDSRRVLARMRLPAGRSRRRAGTAVSTLHRTFEELRNIHDDRTLEDRCLGVLQDFSDREGKRAGAGRREPEHDVQGYGRRECGLAATEDVANRTANRSAGERDQPVRPDERSEGSALRALPGDPVASPRHGRLRDLVADSVGAGAGAADDPGAADSHWRQSRGC